MTVCKLCKGVGYVGIFEPAELTDCPSCDGKGFVEPMTNEEWLKSRSNKELANAIFSAFVESATMIGCCVTLEYFRMQIELIDALREWLKQPHSEVRK